MPYKDEATRKQYMKDYQAEHKKPIDPEVTSRGTARKNALPEHNMISSNPESRTGVCAKCGPVKLIRQGPRWRCFNAATTMSQRSRWLKKYGLTSEMYDDMLADCAGCCEACGVNFEESGKWPCVDHDHNTNEVRGLLCNQCNAAFGLLGDDVVGVKNLLRYAERFTA